jgi:hypothetical protein
VRAEVEASNCQLLSVDVIAVGEIGKYSSEHLTRAEEHALHWFRLFPACVDSPVTRRVRSRMPSATS